MFLFSLFESRKDKELLLIWIIKNLKISDLEKEMYILSLEVLDNQSFKSFFYTITSQVSEEKFWKQIKQTIEPLSWNLI